MSCREGEGGGDLRGVSQFPLSGGEWGAVTGPSQLSSVVWRRSAWEHTASTSPHRADRQAGRHPGPHNNNQPSLTDIRLTRGQDRTGQGHTQSDTEDGQEENKKILVTAVF